MSLQAAKTVLMLNPKYQTFSDWEPLWQRPPSQTGFLLPGVWAQETGPCIFRLKGCFYIKTSVSLPATTTISKNTKNKSKSKNKSWAWWPRNHTWQLLRGIKITWAVPSYEINWQRRRTQISNREQNHLITSPDQPHRQQPHWRGKDEVESGTNRNTGTEQKKWREIFSCHRHQGSSSRGRTGRMAGSWGPQPFMKLLGSKIKWRHKKICLLFNFENRNRDVLVKSRMVARIYTFITHQNVMPHMTRTKHQNVCLDNWRRRQEWWTKPRRNKTGNGIDFQNERAKEIPNQSMPLSTWTWCSG